VTSVTYLPGRGSHLLASAGCADGKVKLWDLRYIEEESAASGCKNFGGSHRKKAKSEDITSVDPLDQGIDVTKQLVPRLQSSKR
jgi:WD40 repeat protein